MPDSVYFVFGSSAKSAVDLRRHEDNHTGIWINCEVKGCKFHARYIWDMRLHCRIAHQVGLLHSVVTSLTSTHSGRPASLCCYLTDRHSQVGLMHSVVTSLTALPGRSGALCCYLTDLHSQVVLVHSVVTSLTAPPR